MSLPGPPEGVTCRHHFRDLGFGFNRGGSRAVTQATHTHTGAKEQHCSLQPPRNTHAEKEKKKKRSARKVCRQICRAGQGGQGRAGQGRADLRMTKHSITDHELLPGTEICAMPLTHCRLYASFETNLEQKRRERTRECTVLLLPSFATAAAAALQCAMMSSWSRSLAWRCFLHALSSS